jgi:hypothetical protein
VRASLILALVVGSVTLSPNHGRAANVGHPVRSAHFASPFKRGLPALGAGPLVQIDNRAHVDARQYQDLSAATQQLLIRYPADRHYFIGLGRDPAPVIAFLQNLGGKQLAINFPASSNNSGSATTAVLAQYVKKLVPADVLESGRTIVFVDVTTTGRALDQYVPLITPSLGGAPVIKAAFGSQFGNSRNWPIYNSPGDKQLIDTTAFPEINQFFTEPYEEVVGEFPRHGPGRDAITVLDSPRPQYTTYRNALMQRMERDEQLDNFLRTQAGPAFQPESPP